MLAGLTLLFAVETSALAPAPVPKAEILGFWKGRSICAPIEAAEFCNDETVAYNVVDVPDHPTTVSLKAGRIEDGAVRPMYAIYLNHRPDERSWTSEITSGERRGRWSYVVKGDEMTGTLVLLPEGTVARTVSVKRVSRDRLLEP
jgi:hypothetical protein